MEKISNLTDRELLILVYNEVLEIKERTTTLETLMDDNVGKLREVEITLYGDDKRKIKGVLHYIDSMRTTILKYNKWEFTAGFIIGAIGILWGVFMAIREFMNK